MDPDHLKCTSRYTNGLVLPTNDYVWYINILIDVATEIEKALETGTTRKVRELPVQNKDLIGRIDEVQFSPHGILIIDDKPGNRPYNYQQTVMNKVERLKAILDGYYIPQPAHPRKCSKCRLKQVCKDILEKERGHLNKKREPELKVSESLKSRFMGLINNLR